MQGHRDSPLTELGRAQAARQADIMAEVFAVFPNLSLFTSPLGRASATAALAFAPRVATPDPRLMEVSVGSWEGRLRAEIVAETGRGDADEAAMFDLFLSAPDGESATALGARMTEFLATLNGPVALVSHGVVSAFLRGYLQGLPRAEISRLSHRQGCVWMIWRGVETCLETPEAARMALAHLRD